MFERSFLSQFVKYLKTADVRVNFVSVKHMPILHRLILVPRAYDPSGLRQESIALGATISGMCHRCRLHSETGWAEFGYFLCYFKMVPPRALDSCRRPEGSKVLGTRMALSTSAAKRFAVFRYQFLHF